MKWISVMATHVTATVHPALLTRQAQHRRSASLTKSTSPSPALESLRSEYLDGRDAVPMDSSRMRELKTLHVVCGRVWRLSVFKK